MGTVREVFRRFCLSVGLVAAVGGHGAPTLSSAGVSLAFDAANRCVTVSYVLTEEDAVVTAAFFRDNVRIPSSEVGDLIGDVNKKVAAGAHSFRWMPPSDEGLADPIAAGTLAVELTLWPTGNEPPYLVAELSGAGGTAYYASAEDVPGGVTNSLYKTEKLVLRRIPAAEQSFTMGSPTSETGRNGDEYQHDVSFSTDFWIGIYPITQRQILLVMNGAFTNAFSSADDSVLRPADSCSFKLARGQSAEANGTVVPTADSCLGRLRTRTGLALDLPTEAQWEYAARAGSSAAFWAEIDAIAWYAENADGETHPVGLKLPNAFGLYDMQGNVRECTLDWYNSNPPGGIDPYVGSGGNVVYRGGGFDQPVSDCRVARRRWVPWGNSDTHNGFRVAIRSSVSSSVEPVVCRGVLADAADVRIARSAASAGYGTPDDPFDSRILTWGESAGGNFDPSNVSGFGIFIR